MFNLKDFVKNGFLKAVGKMADHQISLNSAAWHEKGVLGEQDLADIQAAIDAHNVAQEQAHMLGEGEV